MERLYRTASTTDTQFGNIAFLVFLAVQWLDGVYTYLGIATFGPHIEANPLISSAVAIAGPGTGLAAAKLLAVGCGMLLHLHRVHYLIAVLTVFYLLVAIVPWTMLFLAA
jgi:hypothetical protein